MKVKVQVPLLKTLFILCFMLLIFPMDGYSYNWPWDQGHDSVITDPGDPGGDDTPKQCCLTDCEMCSVYANSGRLSKTFTDLTVPGIGPALRIVRTYDSQDWTTSLLGHGWIFNFGREVIIIRNRDGEKVVGVRLETGERNFFKETPDGTLQRLTPYGVTYDLSKNGDGSYTIKNRDGSRHELRTDGKISKVIDRNNNQLVFEYNSVGCLSKITNASDNYVTFQLGPNGKITSISDNLGRTINYAYDQNGNLVSFSDPMGNTTQYAYNSKNLLTQITDPRGNIVESVTYDNNRPPRVATFTEKGETYTITYYSNYTIKTDSYGNAWTYYYNDVGVITKVVDPLGNVKEQQRNKITATSMDLETDANGNKIIYTWDANGNMASKTDPLGNTSGYTYVAGTNWIETETNPLGVVTKYEYDTSGNQTKIIQDFGGTLQNSTTFTYDNKGNRTIVTDPLNNATRYEYDANGNFTKKTDSLGNITVYTYDSRGNKISETNALGQTTVYYYDILNRLTSVKDALGNAITYAYDELGNKISETDAKGNARSFVYDTYNRLIQITDSMTNNRFFIYDRNDHLLSFTDANGNTTSYNYDNIGRRVSSIDPLGNKTNFTYDSNGNITSYSDANGKITSFIYNSINKIVQKNYSDGATNTYNYDSASNRISETDANGNTTAFTYDNLNRLISTTYSNGESSNYEYDLIGRITRGANTESDLIYTYDTIGQLISTSLNSKIVTYSYNAIGNRIKMNTPNGETIRYFYNNVNQMNRIELSNGKGINFTYDSSNRVIRKDYEGGNYSIYDYDNAGRLTQTRHLTSNNIEIYKQINIFDKEGNLLSKATNYGTINYAYDNLYQLISATNSVLSNENFTYDNVGNRISSSDIPEWHYNNRNQLVSYSNTSFVYDANGNTTSKVNNFSTYNYVYNFENKLKEVKLANNSIASYKYDIEKRRIEKNVNGNITKYLYDGAMLLAEYDNNWNLVRNYFYTEGDVNPTILIEQGKLYYFLHDHINTPQVIIDENGNVVWAAQYRSFGEVNLINQGVINNFRFPGQYYDQETGFYYNWNRNYSPDLGRYQESDPIGLGGGINSYIYGLNNPVLYVDPTGLKIYLQTGNNSGSWLNDQIHQSICVDTWKICCGNNSNQNKKGAKRCFSFGFNGTWKFYAPSDTWLGRQSGLFSGGLMEGEVYEPDYFGGKIDGSINSNCEQDQELLKELTSMVGMKDVYTVGYHNCRRFSQMMFNEAMAKYK